MNAPALTRSEIEIVSYLAQGLSHKEIADKRNMKPTSVDAMLYQVRRKLNLTTKQIILKAEEIIKE